MKYLYIAANWIFGGVFLLAGLLIIFQTPLVGLTFIAISLLLIPPIRNFIYKKTNKEIPVKVRGALIFVLFIAAGVFINQDEDRQAQELKAQQQREQAEEVARIKQQKIKHFNTNRDQIISVVSEALSAKEYQLAVNESGKYLVSGDPELKQMNALAKKHLTEILKKENTARLLNELKTIPTKEYEKNKNLYQQLLSMHPENEKYKKKVTFYSEKVKEKRQQQIAAEARKKKIESQFSAWDGSHYNLERFIKNAMNDPDSYEHAETVYWDQGDHIVVRTIYRGKNTFGGVVKNFVKAKVSLDGHVLQILDQT
mgnify:CR=1 FL=1